MKSAKYKSATDILSMLLTLAAIITGFVLHKEVWHLHLYSDATLWTVHESIGLVLLGFVALHCVQHSFWFKNYSRIRINKKRVTTILLIVGAIVALTGIVLMCGSRSELVSHIHFVGAILFTIIAVGHVVKRWKIFRSLW